MHPYSILGQLLALHILVSICVLTGYAIVAVICWRLDRKHDAMVAQIEQAALVANAMHFVSRSAADALAGRRPMQTGCGAHGPALFRTAVSDARDSAMELYRG
ncbi:hypothetical protein [Xanthomonas vesicatoria]|uniref:hypothetical protein n=1 Tax=Xanthomonas vesicatoria TaxID=56460 RepID=UPI000F8C558B|nr:hypothetical protein [Xanthomonas vesicatoria]